jgi:hypothetical protein
MKRTIVLMALLGLATVLSSCGGGSSSTNNNPPPNANLEGNWEIVATSTTNPGVVSVIDVSLNSVGNPFGSFNGGAWSLQGQPTFYPYDCQGVLILDQNDPLAVTTSGSKVTGTLTDGSAVFNFTGQVSGQGTAGVQFSGTYSSAAGNSTTCQGDGTFIASQAVSLTGNYLGTSGYLTGATLSVTESGGNGGPIGHDVTAVLSGAGTYRGSSMGNVAEVSSGSDVFYIWWDGSTKTLWIWSQQDGASGFTKQ